MVRGFGKWNNRSIIFENEAENAVIINSEQYVIMIHNFFTTQFAHFPGNENILFQ